MADTKNYGLKGVGDDVQFGKAGGRFVYNTGASDFRATTDGTTLSHLQVLDPVGDTDAATKLYVDNTAAGLDPKESCAAATTANLANFTTTSGGQFTSVPATIDGVTLAEGDRVLVKNQSTQTQNGIYVVTATTTTLIRADDHNTSTDITAGNFVFVTEGTTYSDTGWVLQGPDPLTMNSSNLVWVQFSGTGSYTAGDAISLTGTAFDLDFVGGGGLTNSVAIAGGDFIAFSDTTNADTMQLRSMTNVLADLDIVTAAADGILTRTAADTYASRTLTASAVAGDQGISIVNGNGVSGNPTIGLDITGLGAITTVELADTIVVFDGTNNVEATFTDVVQDLDIPNAITTNGLVTRTGADTYASRSVVASAVAGDEGISVVQGDGVAGNITIGLDILGQTNLATDAVDDADEFIMYHSVAGGTEGVGNYAITATKLKDYMNAGTSANQIIQGNSDITVTDAGAGSIATTVDATVVSTSILASTTFDHNLIVSTTNTLTVADLTNNDVLIAGTGGLVEDSGGNLTFDGTTLTVTGAAAIDEITIDGDVISNNTTDQPIIMRPNGTGSIIFQNGSSEEILELNDTASAINGLAITAGATGVPPQITTGTGAQANIDIGFLTNGTGVLSVTAGSGNYEDNVTADDDLPNKKYVDDLVAATGGSGTLDSVTGTVDLTSATTQNIGAAGGIPANATVLSVTLDVTTASDGTTPTVSVGDSTNGVAVYMTTTENDSEVVGIYIADGRYAVGGSAVQATATVVGAGAVGSATCIITFRHA